MSYRSLPPKLSFISHTRVRVASLLGLLLLLPSSGCNTFGSGKLVQELRNENERLLAEFRAERDRREKSEGALRSAERRLAESEKLLAQQYQSSNRLSQRTTNLGSAVAQPMRAAAGVATGFSNRGGLPGTGIEGGLSERDDSGLRWERRVGQ